MDLMTKSVKHDFQFSYEQDEFVFNKIVRSCPTILDHFREMQADFKLTREDVAQHIFSDLSLKVLEAEKEISRIMMGWLLNHLSYVVVDIFEKNLDQYDIYDIDLGALFMDVEHVINNADPELLNVIQSCFLECLVDSLRNKEPELSRLFQYMYLNTMKLLSQNKDYKNTVFVYAHNNKHKIMRLKSFKVCDRPSPSVDYAIVTVEKYMRKIDDKLNQEQEEARQFLKVLKKERDQAYKDYTY